MNRKLSTSSRFLHPMVEIAVLAFAYAKPLHAAVDYAGTPVPVVDAHVHVGLPGDFNLRGKEAIAARFPAFVMLYHTAAIGAAADPYGPHIGARAERDRAGIDRGLFLADYTHHSAGFLSNRDLETFLVDPRNTTQSGGLYAWGMVSMNFDGYLEPGIAELRLEAMRSYLRERPDLFVGIKLSHLHLGVDFDDQRYYGVYDVAAEFGVPVLLRTGLLGGFGETLDDVKQYHPDYLRDAIAAYDGGAGRPLVNFVLAHVGTGDLSAALAAVDLARNNEHVWLDISALGEEIVIGEDGEPTDSHVPMYPYVLALIKEHGLAHRTIYANGHAIPGWARTYLSMIVNEMLAQGFTLSEAQDIFSGSFYRCYTRAR